MKQSTTNHRQTLGKLGEDLASSYLQTKGYTIIDRNFKARYGEIDIIATHKNSLLVFIEVKARIGRVYGLPEEAVTPRKLREVIQTAQYYYLLHPELPSAHRIDVIAIELNTDRTIKEFRHRVNCSV